MSSSINKNIVRLDIPCEKANPEKINNEINTKSLYTENCLWPGLSLNGRVIIPVIPVMAEHA